MDDATKKRNREVRASIMPQLIAFYAFCFTCLALGTVLMLVIL